MTRFVIVAALAVVTPLRRGLSQLEGRLARAEYRIRAGTGALFITLAVLSGCHPSEGFYRSLNAAIAHCDAALETASHVSPEEVDRVLQTECHEAFDRIGAENR